MSCAMPSGRRALFLWILLPALLLPARAVFAAADKSSPPAERESPGKMSLDSWRGLKREMDEALQAPPGPGRIAKCEAFLKEHPGYPDASPLIRTLLDDIVTVGGYDPARLAKLIERTVEGQRGADKVATALWMVEKYCLPYDLPAASAEKLLKVAKEEMDLLEGEQAGNPCPEGNEPERPGSLRARFLLDSGRLRQARGDAVGALELFRAAEEEGDLSGWNVTLRQPGGKQIASLPSGHPLGDWLQLSMAEVLARLGNSAEARRHLSRVRNFSGFYDEITARRERLREELKVPAAAAKEVRADPVTAPDFTLEALGGGRVSLSDYRGKVVLVMLWTSW